jgi:predicted MFS family arabinose efflux permease
MEDKKKVGLIVTAVTAALCGCPGLCLLVFGASMTAGGSVPSEYVDTSGNPVVVGVSILCFGLLMVAIPIGGGVYTFLQSQQEKETVEDEEITEIPPAI